MASSNSAAILTEKDQDGGETMEYPTGEFNFQKFGPWKRCGVQLHICTRLLGKRISNGSILEMLLRGKISDQPRSKFSSGLSLPQICENFEKAMYDPRISGIYLHIEELKCGWGKVEEIRRHILNFKKSGKFVVSYVPECKEKGYYLACACDELYAPPSANIFLFGMAVEASFLGGFFEKAGIEPRVQRIGKYKSFGDHFSRKSMSDENAEMLTAILNNIYENWLDIVSLAKGMQREHLENFINEGVYQVERLKEEGLITEICYEDEVLSLLTKRLKLPIDKKPPMVGYRQYSRVTKWTVGLSGGEDKIAVIRACGTITRTSSLPRSMFSPGFTSEQFIKKIRKIRESKKLKAVIIRIDSPGGDALASDLMWREIRLLAESKPVIASMSDVAASGGYYMAMGCSAIVAENLTLTGSIGVVALKLNLEKLHEKLGFKREIISRGKFAEVNADQRPFRPEEAELFSMQAQHIYKQFRDKAALSRSMPVDKMEEIAQGRVWTGGDAASRGLVDAIGGMSRAVAIAKDRANIPQNKQVRLVEVSKPSSSALWTLIRCIGDKLAGADTTNSTLHSLQETTTSNRVEARMDEIIFQTPKEDSFSNLIFGLSNDYLSSIFG